MAYGLGEMLNDSFLQITGRLCADYNSLVISNLATYFDWGIGSAYSFGKGLNSNNFMQNPNLWHWFSNIS